MTTVGYGDFSPKKPEGRFFAVFIMFIGISFGVASHSFNIINFCCAKKIWEDKGVLGKI
ncbi:MAG: hypothetical protein CM1200mP10_14610 [Candidatus Neomarinimicrobiota bacterium]|nr:MAG: hypothetical protein CM1200mP10_14610 [Candidatus Neomarinimicrobiota bacterium]